MAGYRDKLNHLAPKLNTKLFDVEDLFCDMAECRSQTNNILLYADGNHLSINGSKLVAQKFNKVITP